MSILEPRQRGVRELVNFLMGPLVPAGAPNTCFQSFPGPFWDPLDLTQIFSKRLRAHGRNGRRSKMMALSFSGVPGIRLGQTRLPWGLPKLPRGDLGGPWKLWTLRRERQGPPQDLCKYSRTPPENTAIHYGSPRNLLSGRLHPKDCLGTSNQLPRRSLGLSIKPARPASECTG